ncbi:hypothetical protein BGZ93_010725 [Podila epicladia]|nr:hypothetical protein BGZ93_010725 [Podila epicladia]
MATSRRVTNDGASSLTDVPAVALTAHRSVNVQRITNLRTQASKSSTSAHNNTARILALAQLWNHCASPESYTSSVAIGAVVDLVLIGSLDWNEALHGFENTLTAAEGQSLANIIHALCQLTIAAAEMAVSSPNAAASSTRTVYGVKNNRHPFVTLLTTKSNIDSILVSELDKIINHQGSTKYRIVAFDILVPFLDFCLLDQRKRTTIVSTTIILWIVKTLNACILDEDLGEFVVHLLDYLCTVPARYPLERSHLSTTLQTTIQALVDFFCLSATQRSLNTNYKGQLGGRLLMILLSWTVDMRRFQLPTLSMLQTIQSLLRTRKGYAPPSLPFDILWPLLSFLLMNPPTADEQQIVVDWMHSVISTASEPLDAMIANLAFLPIFQVMGESQSESISKRCSDILQRLETIPRNSTSLSGVAKSELTSPPTGAAAMIHAEMNHLRLAWTAKDQFDDMSSYSLQQDGILSSLTLTTFMFHPDENKRITAITEQAQVEDGRLVTLVLFIYLLRVDTSAIVKLHLLQEAIPSLVTSKDEIVTAKVLRTILTLINGVPNAPTGSKIASSHMGAVGVRILFLIWKRQPRVWKTLRHVIHEWVQNRPRLFKTPLKGEPEYDMEVAVLTTIRDICAYDAAGYADVLIPFLASLLQSVELYASSICTIVETMNLTVEANVVEPRAAWNVLLCHLAEYAMKSGHSGMIRVMCEFYGIVASRNEDTQVYLDLREAVLENYVKPLLMSEDPEILAAAWKALSAFHAQEIITVLPVESPKLLIRQLILEAQDTLVVDEYSLVLDKLVRHELLHMRRGLFKDAASKKITTEVNGASELDRMQGILSVVSTNILQKWQSGDVNPGLRIGYALSSLLCSSTVDRLPSQAFGNSQSQQDATEDASVSAIRARQGYRNVLTALTDVALTDHLVERISAMEGWTALFDNLWVANDDAQTLQIAETLISDLYKKITEGYVPAHCANAVLAITGIILSLHRHSHPASTVQSSLLAKHLLLHFAQQDTASDVGASDEVQFAVLVSLSFITPLAAVDEKLVRSILGVFTDRLEKDSANSITSNELSSWSPFAAGWAFCNLLSGLMDSPTKTAELNEICQQTLQQLMAILESDSTSFALVLGALMAVPRLTSAIASSSSLTSNKDGVVSLEAAAVQKVKASARQDLDAFLENQQGTFTPQRLARLLGAPWVIAFSDRTASTPTERKEDTELLDRVLLAATSRRDLQPQLIHFTVPFCHMIHTNLDVRNPSSSDIALFTGRIHSLVNLIKITPTSAARHTAVIALGSLFGIDWCHGPTVTSMGSHGLYSFLTSTSTMTSVINSALGTLIELGGLSIGILTASDVSIAGSEALAVVIPGFRAPSAKSMLMVQDLKAGRLATFVLGHITCHVHRLGQVDTGKVIGTSSEPKDYSRLPVSTSWLRSLWDGLWEPLQMGAAQRAQKSYKTSLELLLYTVHSLPTPLPAVNWFPLLSQLIALEPELVVPSIHMASRHAMTSTSLMEFLIMTLSSLKAESFAIIEDSSDEAKTGQSPEELFVGEEGIGRILTLGGLPLLNTKSDQALAELDKVRGLEGLAKRLTLPSSRVVDLVEKLVHVLFFGRTTSMGVAEMEVLQLIFLDTLSNHIRQYRQGTTVAARKAARGLVEEGKELLGDLRAIMLRTFNQLSIRNVGTATRVLRRLADLSLTSISHLDAAPLAIALDGTDRDAGARVLKHAIGVASLYRAGYLSAQQESRLTLVAQSALQVMDFYPSWSNAGEQNGQQNDYQLAEAAISVLLYAMNEGIGERPAHGVLSPLQQNKKNALRLTWLQRILDLLVLVSGLPDIFVRGIRLLLGGAVLLLWEEQDVLAAARRGSKKGQESHHQHAAPATGSKAQDAEADLLAMVDEDELYGEDGAYRSLEYNITEDDVFELWHGRFLQTITGAPFLNSKEDDGDVLGCQEKEIEKLYRTSVLGSLSLVLPDIMSGSTSTSSTSSESQAATRVLRLCLDQTVPPQERQLLISVLRRAEELVPRDSSWVLLI